MTSRHYRQYRRRRERVIREIGQGTPYQEFIVGEKLHVITTNAIIIIYGARDHKLITKLIARPNQIKKYYTDGNYPTEIIEIANQHQKAGLYHA